MWKKLTENGFEPCPEGVIATVRPRSNTKGLFLLKKDSDIVNNGDKFIAMKNNEGVIIFVKLKKDD